MPNTKGQSKKKSDLKLVSDIKQLHSEAEKTQLAKLYNQSFFQLAQNFIVEKNAENKAYYFILENNLLKKFASYCAREEKGGVA